jgi:hypothetical protein
MGVNKYKVGDLVLVRDWCNANHYVFRPYGFPIGKVGLVISVENSKRFYEISEEENIYSDTYPYTYPYGHYDYDWRWYYEDLIVILIEGKKYWVFQEEIEFYKK